MLKSAPPVFLNIFVDMGYLGNLPLTFKLENDTLGNSLMRTKEVRARGGSNKKVCRLIIPFFIGPSLGWH